MNMLSYSRKHIFILKHITYHTFFTISLWLTKNQGFFKIQAQVFERKGIYVILSLLFIDGILWKIFY